MAVNDQYLLDEILKQQKNELFPHISDAGFFEYFCAAEILKDFELSYEEVIGGIVDGEHDGGIDSIYAFVNGSLVVEDFDASQHKKDVRIELSIIQSKTSKGFSEDALNKISSTIEKLLNFKVRDDEHPELNESVKTKFSEFRKIYTSLARRFPTLTVNVYYCAKRADDTIHPNMQIKAKEIGSKVEALISSASANVHLISASDLMDMARRIPRTSFNLKFDKILNDNENGFVILTSLEDFNAFLRDENGKRLERLFESNVRDNQGRTPVNKEIRATLREEDTVDFWMLNNGVTVVADRAQISGQTLAIEGPQIVNGLQTSTQILDHFDEFQFSGENRKIMIKVVPLSSEDARDKIIKATNSQTQVSAASLRATDKVQRDIETTLKSVNLFYDRRKNHYKNLGVSPDKIISVPYMAQCIMATRLGRPDDARARPSTLINDEKEYHSLFNSKFDLKSYSNCARFAKSVEDSLTRRADISSKDRNNLRFYVLYEVLAKRFKATKILESALVSLAADSPNADEIESSIGRVLKAYNELGSSDQVAKGTELLRHLNAKIEGSNNST